MREMRRRVWHVICEISSSGCSNSQSNLLEVRIGGVVCFEAWSGGITGNGPRRIVRTDGIFFLF
jgi:hypothetical protein